MATPNTPIARQSRSGSSRNGTAIAVKMMIPPIVGVPAFAWWPSGPSSRMFCPNSRARRKAMNFGERKMQISSEAVPAIRTSPTGQGLRDGLEADPARCLHQHDVAGRDQLADELGGGVRVGDVVRLAVDLHEGREWPHGDQDVDGGRGRVRADLPVRLLGFRAELEHVPEHGDAPPRGRLRGEIVERGAHGQRVGVVAVVDDGDPRGEVDTLAAEGPEAHVDAPVWLYTDGLGGRDRCEQVHQLVTRRERDLELDAQFASDDRHIRRVEVLQEYVRPEADDVQLVGE